MLDMIKDWFARHTPIVHSDTVHENRIGRTDYGSVYLDSSTNETAEKA